jgi:lysophospholipase L1-like esterase
MTRTYRDLNCRFLSIFALLWACAAISTRTTAANQTSVRPIERKDENSRIAHRELLAKAKQGGIDIYFEGDSITRRWGASDPQYRELLKNWKANFFGWNSADFGWGGDKLENILWRLENGELDGVHPKVIVILAGINNLGRITSGPDQARQIVAGQKAILEVCRKKAPEATIVLTAIFPRNDNMAAVPVINQINSELAKMTDGKSIRFININSKIANENGRFFDGMVNRDKLHPTVKTYQIWADALKPIFTEILGPPAKTDHAPPPTGDPSQRKKHAAK